MQRGDEAAVEMMSGDLLGMEPDDELFFGFNSGIAGLVEKCFKREEILLDPVMVEHDEARDGEEKQGEDGDAAFGERRGWK